MKKKRNNTNKWNGWPWTERFGITRNLPELWIICIILSQMIWYVFICIITIDCLPTIYVHYLFNHSKRKPWFNHVWKMYRRSVDSEEQADEFDWSFTEDKAASKQLTLKPVNVWNLQHSIHNWIECHSLRLTNRLKTESSREIVSSSYESLKGKTEHVKFNLPQKVETN